MLHTVRARVEPYRSRSVDASNNGALAKGFARTVTIVVV